MELIKATNQLNIAYRSAPFTGRFHQAALPQGLTCAEIIATVPDIDTRRFLESGIFCINGEVVPREMWACVKPKARKDIIVTMHMPILGGGGEGGSKDIIRLVASIAILVVATAVSGGAAAGLLGSAFSAGTIGATILAGAISIGGALLLGALVKPPSADKDDTLEDTSGSPAALSGNQLRRGASIPRTVGTHRAYPPFLSQPLVDVVEYDEVVESVYGLAGPHQLRDVKFGDVFADDIDPDQLDYQFYELIPGEGGVSASTQLMFHFNGIQDSESYPDSSQYERTASATGSVFIDKLLREAWLGRAAAYFNQATEASFLTVPMTPGLAIGGLDWTVDFVLEFDDIVGTGGSLYYLCGQVNPLPPATAATATTAAWYVYKDTSGRLNLVVSNGEDLYTVTTTTNVEAGAAGQKYHFAGGRIGDVLYAWVDGVQEATYAAFSGLVPTLAAPITIGAQRSSASGATPTGQAWPGWINEFRFNIGEAGFPATDFTPLEVPYKPAVPDLITRYGKTIQPAIKLNQHRIKNDEDTQGTRDKLTNQDVPSRSLPTTQSIVLRGRGLNEIWVSLGFQAGLSYFDDDFERDWFNGVAFRIRIREVGSAAWKNLPEVHVHERRTAPFIRMLVFRWDNDILVNETPGVSPPAQKAWKAAYSTVPTQTIAPVGTGGWEADAHFYASDGGATYLLGDADGGNAASTGLRNIRLTTERAEFFVNNLVARGPLEIEVRRSQLYIADKFTYATYEMNTDPPGDAMANGVVDLFGYQTVGTDQVILLKQSNSGDQIFLSRCAAVWNSPPIAREGVFATVYAKVRGRNLEALSALASGLVPDYDGTSVWTGLNATSNPAPHYRYVLTGELNDNRIPESMVDDSVLIEWRQRCEDLGFTCDAVFDGDNVDRVLDVIASCGYARPRQAEVWDVAQDRDYSEINPVQMFGPRNMRGFRWEKAFVRHRPDGLRVRYSDSADNYVERTVVVPRAGVIAADAGRLEEIRYDGLVTERSVVTKATYDQRQVTDRFTFYYGEVDAEMLVCRRGDLVLVQHDTLDNYAGFSRVLSVTTVDDVVATITLDGSVTPTDAFFEASPPFFVGTPEFFSTDIGVAIRLKDGTTITFTAALSEDGFVLTPSQAIVGVGDLLERECLVMTGRIIKSTRRLVVFDIAPRADLTAQITFVDEAPVVWDFPAELPPIPPDVPSVRMFHQFVETLHQDSDNRVRMHQQYAEVSYTPDPGSVQMFQQFVEVVYSSTL